MLLSNINKNTSSCFLNQAYLEYSLIEKDGISCTKNINEIYQQKNFNIHHVPKINTTIFTIFIIFLITEIKFFNQYLKLKDIHLRKDFPYPNCISSGFYLEKLCIILKI